VLCGVSLLIIAVGYWLIIQDSWATYAGLKEQEKALKVNFERKQQQIVNVVEYHQQLNLITKRVVAMINKLPVKNEMPGLLEEISNAVLASGLKVTLFTPQAELTHDFYVTLPIKISVHGSYFQLATFINQIAKMNRIVTLHEFSIKRALPKEHQIISDDELVMYITVKLYRQRTSS
jgi:type IV pilus assembly protein PilO